MTSPLYEFDGFKKFFFDVILNDPIRRNRAVYAVRGDKIKLIFEIFNNRDEGTDLDGVVPDMKFSNINNNGAFLALENTEMEIDGNVLTCTVDTADFTVAGTFQYQAGLTKAGNRVTVASDRIQLSPLIEE